MNKIIEFRYWKIIFKTKDKKYEHLMKTPYNWNKNNLTIKTYE